MSEFSSSVPPLEESSIPEHLIPKEEWYEAYVRYGLYVGAAFQLACILAVLVLPGDKGAAAGDGGDEGVRARGLNCAAGQGLGDEMEKATRSAAVTCVCGLPSILPLFSVDRFGQV